MYLFPYRHYNLFFSWMCLQKPLLRQEHRWEKPIAANVKLRASSAVETARSTQGQTHYLFLKFLQTLLFRCNEPRLDPVWKDRKALNFEVGRLQLHTWVSGPCIWRLGIWDVDFPRGFRRTCSCDSANVFCWGLRNSYQECKLTWSRAPLHWGGGYRSWARWAPRYARRERKCILLAMQKMCINAVSGTQFSNVAHCIFLWVNRRSLWLKKHTLHPRMCGKLV